MVIKIISWKYAFILTASHLHHFLCKIQVAEVANLNSMKPANQASLKFYTHLIAQAVEVDDSRGHKNTIIAPIIK